MSNFNFLLEWPELQEHAKQAEALVTSDPRSSCFYSRYTLERTVYWIYEFDAWLARVKPKHDTTLNTLINQSEFKTSLGSNVFPKIKAVQKAGNNAVHSERKVAPTDSVQSLKELHHILYWFYRTYTSSSSPSNQVFDLDKLPQTIQVDAKLVMSSAKKLKELQKELTERDDKHQASIEKERKQNQNLQEQLAALQKQLAEQKEQNAKTAETEKDPHDYCEAETRKYLIDQYLTEMGWNLDAPNVKEFPVSGMPISKQNSKGKGKVDYVLWGEDGRPLAVIEAKKTARDAREGKYQAELYANCLEQDPRFIVEDEGQRPLIYYTNGYDIYLWDDTNYPARKVQGFLSQDEMQRIVDRRKSAMKLKDIELDTNIAGQGRPYQRLAIESVCEQFDIEKQRKSLLVMATGTGKTRTTIALVDALMRAGWVKNVLFLADRNALVNQAKKEFSKLLPKASPEILSSGT